MVTSLLDKLLIIKGDLSVVKLDIFIVSLEIFLSSIIGLYGLFRLLSLNILNLSFEYAILYLW